MTDVTIARDADKLLVTSPYNPDLPHAARSIGGAFQGKDGKLGVWRFDVRDEQRVRDLYRKIYGTDGTVAGTVTVHLNLDLLEISHLAEFYFAGRKVAWRRGRDETVSLGDKVVLIQGGFPGRGGSMKYPQLDPDTGTVLEVRDLPAGHADLDLEGVTVLDTSIDRDALAAERAALVARLAEIDALLNQRS